jgi:alginate biosynthesis protein Alg44
MSAIGQPVSVVFDTFSGSSVGAAASKLHAAISWAGEKIAAVLGHENEVATAPKEAKEPNADSGRRLAGLKPKE